MHRLNKSIDSVNIGGFPFLPNSTDLVEQFIDNLLNKIPEQLQKEGILPKGSYVEVTELYSADNVLIIVAQNDDHLQHLLTNSSYAVPAMNLSES